MKNVTFYQIVYYQRGLRYSDHWKIVKLYIFVLKNFFLWKSVQTGHCIGDNGFRNSSNSKKIRTKLCKINSFGGNVADPKNNEITRLARFESHFQVLRIEKWLFRDPRPRTHKMAISMRMPLSQIVICSRRRSKGAVRERFEEVLFLLKSLLVMHLLKLTQHF